jgi:cytochrome P450
MDTERELDPEARLFAGTTPDDPRAVYDELRTTCPVARTQRGSAPNGTVVISRYDDVWWALRHPEIFTSEGDPIGGAEQPQIPLQVDPPLHTKYRRLLNPQFVPREIEKLEPQVRALVAQLLDGFAARGHCDFHEEFAMPLPSGIFLTLMGLPLSDLPEFRKWTNDTIRPDVAPGDFEGAARVRAAASRAITEYFRSAIAERRAQPDDSLLSCVVHGEIDGQTMTETELLGISHLLLLGGLDTVTATLDCMVFHLANEPALRRALVADPSAIPGAIEELLRWETPVMVVPRTVKQAVELRDVSLEPGDSVWLLLGAANHDAEAFTDHAVDFARDPNRHVAFGGSHHLCLGAHLARLELRVSLEELHRRVPDYAVADGAEIRFSPGIRQVNHLPLVWEPVRD